MNDVKATALAQAVAAIGQMAIGFEPPEFTAARAAVFETFLSAAADTDVQGAKHDEQSQHDENRDDDNTDRGVTDIAEIAARLTGSDHVLTVPGDILAETASLLDAEGFQRTASRLLRNTSEFVAAPDLDMSWQSHIHRAITKFGGPRENTAERVLLYDAIKQALQASVGIA